MKETKYAIKQVIRMLIALFAEGIVLDSHIARTFAMRVSNPSLKKYHVWCAKNDERIFAWCMRHC